MSSNEEEDVKVDMGADEGVDELGNGAETTEE